MTRRSNRFLAINVGNHSAYLLALEEWMPEPCSVKQGLISAHPHLARRAAAPRGDAFPHD